MMRVIRMALTCVAVLVAMAGQVQSGVIFSTGLQTSPQNTGQSSDGTTFKVFDNFSVLNDEILRSVLNWQIGVNSGTATNLGSFTFEIYEGDAFVVNSLNRIFSQTLAVADYNATVDPAAIPGLVAVFSVCVGWVAG